MTMRPMRPCGTPGCPELVRPPAVYCPAHTWTDEQRRQHRRIVDRDYDRHRRDQRARAFYKSAAWERLRRVVLARDNYLCQRCLEHQRITPATTVDHIVPLSVAWERRLDMSNLRSLCGPCHNAVRAEQGGGWWGPGRAPQGGPGGVPQGGRENCAQLAGGQIGRAVG